MITIELGLIYLSLGAFVGFMAGLLGIGGGGIMVPVLTTLFLYQGIALERVVHLALGTSMASIIFTSLSSMRAHNARGGVDWLVVKPMAIGVIVGVFSATYIATLAKASYLAIFFSMFMAYSATQMFLDKKPKPSSNITGSPEKIIAGAGIGLISALVSIGGGTLTVPYLLWRNFDLKKAIGTSAALGFPLSVGGTVGYIVNGWSHTSSEAGTLGLVYLPAVIFISMSSFFFAPLGARYAHRLPVPTLKKVFAVMMIALSIKMLSSVV